MKSTDIMVHTPFYDQGMQKTFFECGAVMYTNPMIPEVHGTQYVVLTDNEGMAYAVAEIVRYHRNLALVGKPKTLKESVFIGEKRRANASTRYASQEATFNLVQECFGLKET